MIYYFSGTGNSKYVAQRLAEALDDSAVSVSDNPIREIPGGEPVGFVSPTYFWGLPWLLADFVSVALDNLAQTALAFAHQLEVRRRAESSKLRKFTPRKRRTTFTLVVKVLHKGAIVFIFDYTFHHNLNIPLFVSRVNNQ